ncbi:hypothetical protein OQA88_9980 [Cercophora sp. LCS_1]
MTRLFLTLFAVLVVFGSRAAASSQNDDLTVYTKHGAIHGAIDPSTPNVRQFLGIPYAQPPINTLRFAPPKPALPFDSLNATRMSPSCMQYANTISGINVNDILEFNLGGLNGTTSPISEDCLTLSMWTPRHVPTTAKLPVIVFFYGGAFLLGGTDTPYQIPSRWIERSQSHIVISFNHRDGIFGYPNAAGLPLQSQNIALLDIRLAIEWVRDNIASFGGDPSRIGLWGPSSGAIAIAYYTYTYVADPIINSVILDSGNEFIDILTYDDAHANFTAVAARFGCGELSPVQELECMRRVDALSIMEFLHQWSDNGTTPLFTFSPVVDNLTVLGNYSAAKMAKIPALIGSTAQDGNMFVPYDPDGVDEAAADEITMVWFFCPAYRAAKKRVREGVEEVYRYVYAGNFSNVSPRGWMGAFHGSEMPLVFGTHGLWRGASTVLEEETSRVMQDVWVEFVATGGRITTVERWDGEGVDGGRVVEFGNSVPARVVDMGEKEKVCRDMGLG